MKALALIVTLLVALSLAACGTTTVNNTSDPPINRWSGSTQKAYMGGCTGAGYGVSKEECICTLEWLEARFTADEAITALDAGTLPVKDAAAACQS